jgi:hypothetical protein
LTALSRCFPWLFDGLPAPCLTRIRRQAERGYFYFFFLAFFAGFLVAFLAAFFLATVRPPKNKVGRRGDSLHAAAGAAVRHQPQSRSPPAERPRRFLRGARATFHLSRWRRTRAAFYTFVLLCFAVAPPIALGGR